MPRPPRKPSEVAQQVVPLLLLAVGLQLPPTTPRQLLMTKPPFWASPHCPFARHACRIFLRYWRARTPLPLFDILLHFWLRATGGSFEIPARSFHPFFRCRTFLLGRASAVIFTGSTDGVAVIWIGVLWPFGFHFARLAGWYSFSFFLVAGLTLSYFKYLEKMNPRPLGGIVFLFSLCLSLDELFWLGHSHACLSSGSNSAHAIQRTRGNSPDSPGNSRAPGRVVSASHYSISCRAFSWHQFSPAGTFNPCQRGVQCFLALRQ